MLFSDGNCTDGTVMMKLRTDLLPHTNFREGNVFHSVHRGGVHNVTFCETP